MAHRALRWTGLACALVLGGSGCRPSARASEPEPEPPAVSEYDALCSHSYEVLIAAVGAGSPGVRDSFMAGCVGNAQARREAMGEAAWQARGECILASEDAVALGRCDGREPVAAPTPSPEPAVSQSAVCDKLIDLMVAEVGPGVIPSEQLPEYRRQCMEGLDEAYASDPAVFNRQARCILDAIDFGDIANCEDL